MNTQAHPQGRWTEPKQAIVYAGPCYGRVHRILSEPAADSFAPAFRVQAPNGREFECYRCDLEFFPATDTPAGSFFCPTMGDSPQGDHPIDSRAAANAEHEHEHEWRMAL